MRKLKIMTCSLLCCMVLSLISCDLAKDNKQKKDETSNSGRPDTTLQGINRQIETAVYNNDYDTILKFYADDAVIASDFKPMLKGKNAIRESILEQKKDGSRINSFHAKADKMWGCNNNIYEYGTYGLSITSNVTKHPYAFSGSYFMIWERQNDKSYLIKYMISNLDFNPCKDFY
jgi:ketosteroid isomerase-like protein